jgi:hypothetical protein
MELKCLPIPKDFLTEPEAVKYTTMSRDTLREARDTNKLPYRRYGKKVIYEQRHLKEWVESFELYINGKVRNKH